MKYEKIAENDRQKNIQHSIPANIQSQIVRYCFDTALVSISDSAPLSFHYATLLYKFLIHKHSSSYRLRVDLL